MKCSEKLVPPSFFLSSPFSPMFLQRRCRRRKTWHIVPNERGCYNLGSSEGNTTVPFFSSRILQEHFPIPVPNPTLLQAFISHVHGHVLPRRRSWCGGSRTIRCCRNRRVSWQRGAGTRFRKSCAVGRRLTTEAGLWAAAH